MELIFIIFSIFISAIGFFLWKRNRDIAIDFAEVCLRNVVFEPQTNMFLLMLRRKRIEHERHETIQRVGKVFGFRSLGTITIVCGEPEIAEQVM